MPVVEMLTNSGLAPASDEAMPRCARLSSAAKTAAVPCSQTWGSCSVTGWSSELEFRVAADAEDDGVDELGWVLRVAQGFGDGRYVLDVAGVDGEIFVEGLGRDVVGGAQHVDQFLGCPC